MQCHCGGQLELKSGFSKKTNKPYAFYGCNGFRRGCKQSLTVEEYEQKAKDGVAQLKKGDLKVREWVSSQHRSYTPKQKTNPNRDASVQYRQLTDEQEAAITEMRKPGVHMIRVNADAGTGKSTLLIQMASRLPAKPNELTTGVILSFGKRPATEMIPLLPGNWAAATVHSVGNDACAAAYGVNKFNPNEYKTKDILNAEYGPAEQPERVTLYSAVEHMVDMAKALVLTETTPDDIFIEQAAFYNLDITDTPNEVTTMVRQILKIGNSREGIKKFGHDFGDMVYLPVRHKLPVATYRYVAVDEAQDSSPARMRLALMITQESLGIVGDSMQAIFGFTFADTKSMETFGQLMGERCMDFGITINWRCPEIVLRLARILCPTIKARPNAPLGAIHEIADEQFYRIVKPGDVVLCRVNADLIHAAYELIKQGIGAVVLGRDIALHLKNLIVKLGRNKDGSYIKTLAFLNRLNAWYNAEQETLAAKNLRNPERAYQKLDDDYQCILALCGVEINEYNELSNIGIPSIEGVMAKLDKMFGEETDEGFDRARIVLLSTVHKFKGGQAARIYVLRADENHPHPMAVSEWEQLQEICILHVATTRCGDGTEREGQALFFVGAMPALYRNSGGAELITPYEGDIRE